MPLDALSDLLAAARSEARRDRLALVSAENVSQRITYGQLDALCSQLGLHLRRACGLAAGDVVSIVLPRRASLAQVVGTLGAMAARPAASERGAADAARSLMTVRRRGSCRHR